MLSYNQRCTEDNFYSITKLAPLYGYNRQTKCECLRRVINVIYFYVLLLSQTRLHCPEVKKDKEAMISVSKVKRPSLPSEELITTALTANLCLVDLLPT